MMPLLFLEFDRLSHEIIGNGARAAGKTESVVHAIEDAIAAAERRKNPEEIATQRCELATFLHRHAFNTNEAIEGLEQHYITKKLCRFLVLETIVCAVFKSALLQ